MIALSGGLYIFRANSSSMFIKYSLNLHFVITFNLD